MSTSQPASASPRLRTRLAALSTLQRRQLYSDTLTSADLAWWTSALLDELALDARLLVTPREIAALADDGQGRVPLSLDAIVAQLVTDGALLPLAELEALRRAVNVHAASPSLLSRLVSWLTPSLFSASPSASSSPQQVMVVRRVLDAQCNEVASWIDAQEDSSALVLTLSELEARFPHASTLLPWLQERLRRAYAWRTRDGQLAVTLRRAHDVSTPLPEPQEERVFAHDAAVLRLRGLLDALQRRVTQLDARIKEGTQRALDLHKTSDKRRALQQLKMVRAVRAVRDNVEQQLMEAERVLEAVQTSALNVSVVEAMRGASAALRVTHAATEDVDAVMDELQDALDTHEDVAQALRDQGETLLPSEALDEDALERELRELVSEVQQEAQAREDAEMAALMAELSALDITRDPPPQTHETHARPTTAKTPTANPTSAPARTSHTLFRMGEHFQ